MSFQDFSNQKLNVVEKMPLRLMIGPIIGGGLILSSWLLAIPAGMMIDSISANAAEERALTAIGGRDPFLSEVQNRKVALERAIEAGIDSRVPNSATLDNDFTELLEKYIEASTFEERGNPPGWGQSSDDFRRQLLSRLEQAKNRTQSLLADVEKDRVLGDYINIYTQQLDNVDPSKLVFVDFTTDDNLSVSLVDYYGADFNENDDAYVISGVPFKLNITRTCENSEDFISEQTITREVDLIDDLTNLFIEQC